MVKVSFIKIIKKVCELTYTGKNDSQKTGVKNNVEVNRHTVFDGGPRIHQNLKIKKVRLDELNRIKAEEKGRKIIERKHHKVAYSDHVESGLAAMAPEDVCKGIKNKQEPCNKLKQNQRAAAVVFKLMSRKQKYTNLETEKGQPKKNNDANQSNSFTHT